MIVLFIVVPRKFAFSQTLNLFLNFMQIFYYDKATIKQSTANLLNLYSTIQQANIRFIQLSDSSSNSIETNNTHSLQNNTLPAKLTINSPKYSPSKFHSLSLPKHNNITSSSSTSSIDNKNLRFSQKTPNIDGKSPKMYSISNYSVATLPKNHKIKLSAKKFNSPEFMRSLDEQKIVNCHSCQCCCCIFIAISSMIIIA